MESITNFYEVYDFYHISIWQNLYFKSFFIFLLSLIFVFVVIGFFKFLKKKRVEKVFAWDWAIIQVKKLNLNKCHSKKDFKTFYFLLTDIAKEYLKKRYGWETINKTDEELLNYLKSKKFDKDLLLDLRTIKENAMWIKFAGQDVLRVKAEMDMKSLINLIEKTKKEVDRID